LQKGLGILAPLAFLALLGMLKLLVPFVVRETDPVSRHHPFNNLHRQPRTRPQPVGTSLRSVIVSDITVQNQGWTYHAIWT
jgi:hypothetical protein